jgi:hypothetical protein
LTVATDSEKTLQNAAETLNTQVLKIYWISPFKMIKFWELNTVESLSLVVINISGCNQSLRGPWDFISWVYITDTVDSTT